MATKIAVALEDDLDGSPADETVRFAIGGTEYEIDLSKKNAKTFRKGLAPFTEHAHARMSALRSRAAEVRAGRHPGMGESQRHPGQHPWTHPRQRRRAIRRRHQITRRSPGTPRSSFRLPAGPPRARLKQPFDEVHEPDFGHVDGHRNCPLAANSGCPETATTITEHD